MLKKTVTYTITTWNDDDEPVEEEITEDLYFHLTEAEVVELEMSDHDGLSKSLQRMIDLKDGTTIVYEMRKIILKAYGIRTEGGRRHLKNQQVRDEFAGSEAFSQVFMEIVLDTDSMIAFVNGIVPRDIRANVEAVVSDLKKKGEEEKKEPRIVNQRDLREMDQDDLAQLGTDIAEGRATMAEDVPGPRRLS